MDADAEKRFALLESLMGTDRTGIRGGAISLKAPFGWPGSKMHSTKHLLKLVPHTGRYCEPFGGSMALLLARTPEMLEVYNDRHGGLVDFWLCMRDQKEELVEQLEYMIYARELWEVFKETWENDNTRLGRAVKWYYVTLYSFSQLGRNWGRGLNPRTNSAGKLQRHLANFHELTIRLRNVIIENMDWRKVLSDYDHEDMTFYLDPPYIQTPPGTYAHMMSLDDHKELLNRIFKLKGTVALSGYHHELIDSYPWTEAYEWGLRDRMTPMAFTPTNHKKKEDFERGTDVECLWLKR